MDHWPRLHRGPLAILTSTLTPGQTLRCATASFARVAIAVSIGIPGLLYTFGATTSSALTVTKALAPVPHATSAQAGQYLNFQRTANGLPPVRESASLNADCQTYIAQHPVRARSSASAAYTTSGFGEAGVVSGGVGQWNRTHTPFGDDPEDLNIMYNPLWAEYGYAETNAGWGAGSTCLRVSFPSMSAPSTPVFYSYPGNGMTQVRPIEIPGETETEGAPKLFNLPGSRPTGPNMVLWAVGPEVTLQKASLGGPDGPVEIAVAPPELEGFISIYYLVPPNPLLPDTHYELTATWETSAGATYTQTTEFMTDSETREDFICEDCAHGSLRLVIRGNRAFVTLRPAAGQTVLVYAGLANHACAVGRGVSCRVCDRGKCHAGEARYNFAPNTIVVRRIKHYRHTVVIALPRPTRMLGVRGVTATTKRFVADGYQWQETVVCARVCVP
jgi:hypothetical protein